ncbi:helix-turn-helix transcriptional regulator [Ochrobactrum sp. Marseille-Q0166]|uniref:helix-turn-helix domain-containing protein n=1 Tax=Ochrobactrum sp. Marseille-Q0166 TaxID=2761105 RepID=UPI0032B33001
MVKQLATVFRLQMEIHELLAINLRRIRVARGISQDELALISGVERAYTGRLERGLMNPTIKTLAKLATALQCDVRDFFDQPDQEAFLMENLRPGRKSASGN